MGMLQYKLPLIGDTPDLRRSAPELGPRHQFPLGLPAFLLFLFYETTNVENHNVSLSFCCSTPRGAEVEQDATAWRSLGK